MISIKDLRKLANTRSEKDIWLSNMMYRIEVDYGFDGIDYTNITDTEFKKLVKIFNTIDEYITTFNEAVNDIIHYKEPSKDIMNKLETTKKILEKHPEIYIDTRI